MMEQDCGSLGGITISETIKLGNEPLLDVIVACCGPQTVPSGQC